MKLHKITSLYREASEEIPREVAYEGLVQNISHQRPSDICAKLITSREGRKEAIVLSLTNPATIGRDGALCSYAISDGTISSVHCKLYAVRSPNGGVIVSCQVSSIRYSVLCLRRFQDLSRNGIYLNGQKIRKNSIILMDGDVLGLPDATTFVCVHLWKEPQNKITIFDPTPPVGPTAQKTKRIGKYQVAPHILGSGSFATVHLAVDPSKHRQVACKSIRIKRESEMQSVMKEVRILMQIRHPNINRIYGAEQTSGFIHIFLQLCVGGDLFTYITSHSKTSNRLLEAEAKYIMFQLLKALCYLHENSISHRDIKPENILLFTPGSYPRIQLADFGLARPNAYQETLNVCGTVSYLPPEGILALDTKDLGYVGMPADCWSAGVILFIMLSGGHPFDFGASPLPSKAWFSHASEARSVQASQCPSQSYLQSEAKLKSRIVNGTLDFERYPWYDLDDARTLVESMLAYDPQQRSTAHSAIRSRWISNELDDLEAVYDRRILGIVRE